MIFLFPRQNMLVAAWRVITLVRFVSLDRTLPPTYLQVKSKTQFLESILVYTYKYHIYIYIFLYGLYKNIWSNEFSYHPTCFGGQNRRPASIFLEKKIRQPGLRTLVIGCRSIPAEEASAWLTRFHEARLSLVEKFHHGRGRWFNGGWGGRNLQKLAHENIERKMNLKQNIHDEDVNFLRGGFHNYRSNPPQRMELWQEARNEMSSWWRLHFGVGRSKEEHTPTNRAKL